MASDVSSGSPPGDATLPHDLKKDFFHFFP